MMRIDVSAVLRNSANLPFSDLVTRPTGAAVRRGLEAELAALREGDVAMLDFSSIGMMDYSCADEVVAKLLLALHEHDASPVAVVFHGITDVHLEAIEDVLLHHGLALVVHFADGGVRLVGAVTEDERALWDLVLSRGSGGAAELAGVVGRELGDVARTLDSLRRRRLLRHDGLTYAPVGPVS